jgi:hypothetical protein
MDAGLRQHDGHVLVQRAGKQMGAGSSTLPAGGRFSCVFDAVLHGPNHVIMTMFCPAIGTVSEFH